MILDIKLKKRWLDLSVKDILAVSNLFLQGNPEQDFLLKAFMLLHGLSAVNKDMEVDDTDHWFWIKQKGKRKPFLVGVEQLTAAAQAMAFLKDDIDEMLPVKFKRLKSPHARLYNFNVEQYINAENFWIAYIKTQDETYLHKLAATLYLPIFSKFKSSKIKKCQYHFKNVDPAKLNAVYLFYTGARKYLKMRFPHIFKEVPTNDQEKSNPKHLTAIVRALNGGDVTKNPKIYKTPLYQALEQLDDMSEQAEKYKTA